MPPRVQAVFVASAAFVKAASTLIKKLDEAVLAAYGWKSDLPSRMIC